MKKKTDNDTEAVNQRFVTAMNRLMFFYGLSKSAFAQRIGAAPQNISAMDGGTRGASMSMLIAVCREFRVRPDWLFLGNGEMLPDDLNKELADKTLAFIGLKK